MYWRVDSTHPVKERALAAQTVSPLNPFRSWPPQAPPTHREEEPRLTRGKPTLPRLAVLSRLNSNTQRAVAAGRTPLGHHHPGTSPPAQREVKGQTSSRSPVVRCRQLKVEEVDDLVLPSNIRNRTEVALSTCLVLLEDRAQGRGEECVMLSALIKD